ncbi:MAG: hypothetical protein ACRBF0_10105 [Calditrichia bacterium]
MQNFSNKFRRFLHEYIGDIIIVLSVSFVLLGSIRGYQYWASTDELAQIKTMTDLAKAAITTLIGAIAAIAGYRRYFKGRTFSERAVIELTSKPICEIQVPQLEEDPENDGNKRTSEKMLLHAVDVAIENIGSLTIWEPKLRVSARHLDSIEEFTQYGFEDKIETEVAPLSISGIEPGEKIFHHVRFIVPKDIPAFRVDSELSTSRNNIWHRATTVANFILKKD